jgi:hypothetical protein
VTLPLLLSLMGRSSQLPWKRDSRSCKAGTHQPHVTFLNSNLAATTAAGPQLPAAMDVRQQVLQGRNTSAACYFFEFEFVSPYSCWAAAPNFHGSVTAGPAREDNKSAACYLGFKNGSH